jgi:parallel beta-helix repeat protein
MGSICPAVLRRTCAVAAVGAAAAWHAASGAVLCVDTNPRFGCPYATIGKALSAAPVGATILVAAGTYSEDVHIVQPVSLIGVAGALRTIINAKGLANGIFIDGIGKSTSVGPGNNMLEQVTVTGFTVENADFEGILVANASNIMVWGNRIIQNNTSLNANNLTCSGIPKFETEEGEDCGEGIHLTGVDHSTIASNIVSLNAGGILVSDDTGPANANVIEDNEISDNPFDCGVTLASHPPATITGSKAPLGVFGNTVARNKSTDNGYLVPGEGAGIGLFALGPGDATYGNVVVGNRLTRNGLPGVVIHGQAAGATSKLSDNVISGNYIAGNGGDNDVETKPAPTGISLLGMTAVTGTVITFNEINDETVDVAVNNAGGTVIAHLNNLLGRSASGIANLGPGVVDASENWWGCSTGPGTAGCAMVSGADVVASPFLSSPAIAAGK